MNQTIQREGRGQPGVVPASKAAGSGTSPLLLAVENGHFELAIALVDAGADAKIIERFSAAADHPVALEFPEGEYLKGLLVVRS